MNDILLLSLKCSFKVWWRHQIFWILALKNIILVNVNDNVNVRFLWKKSKHYHVQYLSYTFSVLLVLLWTYNNFRNNDSWRVVKAKNLRKKIFYYLIQRYEMSIIWNIHLGNKWSKRISHFLNLCSEVFVQLDYAIHRNKYNAFQSDWHTFPLTTYIDILDLVVIFMLI